MTLSIEKRYSVDLDKPLNVQYGGGLMFTGDAGADTFEVTLYKSGEACAPGGSVALNCIRADGNTVTVAGSISGNVASATLTQACCAIPGPLSVVMQIISGGNTGAVFAAAYTVMPAQTGEPIDPGTTITDIAALIAQIDAAVDSIPADYSDLLAAIAPTFSTSTAYAAGDYVWYDGDLYKFTAAHSAGAWTGSDVAAAVFATDISELKSALDDYLPEELYNGNPLSNETILTSSDVSAADEIYYDFTVPTGTATYLDVLDTNGTRITYIGKGSSGSGDLVYQGSYTIPSNFGSIKFSTNASSQARLTHIRLYFPSDQSEINTDVEVRLTDVEATLNAGVDPSYADVSESHNLFTQKDMTAGVYLGNDNTTNSNASALVSDYIAVNGGDTIRCTKFGLQASQTLQVYDSSKAHIRHYNYSEEEETLCWKAVLPSNAAYIRLNVFFRDMGQIVIVANREYDGDLAGENGKYISIKNGYTYTGKLTGKKIAYNGDSICEGRYGGNSDNGGAYANLISLETSSGYENRAISGGILASAVPSGNLPNRCVVTDVTNMAADADLVCFEGGYNDYARDVPLGAMTAESDLTGTVDTTTICGALESIFRQAISRWLGKPIVFVIVHKVQGSYYTQNSATTPYTFKDVHDKIVDICHKYAIPYYDACLESGLNGHNVDQSAEYLTSNSTGASDGTHPNAAGYRRYYVPQLISLFESVIPVTDDE